MKFVLSIVTLGIVIGGVYLYVTEVCPQETGAGGASATSTIETSTIATTSSQGAVTGTSSVSTSSATTQTNIQHVMHATFKTNRGDITLELYADRAPNTVANFVKLAQAGFYNGVKFHRVIQDFMIQGGDPLSKDDSKQALWGTGGPGYTFADEIGPSNNNEAGTIAMANAGPNTNGSQFFINTANNNFLNTKHTVFGKVIAGMDVVTAIEHTKTGANDRPVEAQVIESIVIE